MSTKMWAPLEMKGRMIIFADGQSAMVGRDRSIQVPDKEVPAMYRQGLETRPPRNIRSEIVSETDTILPAELLCGGSFVYIFSSGSSAATVVYTTDSAVNIAAMMPDFQEGDMWRIRIINKNQHDLQISAGAGVTIDGVSVCATDEGMTFLAEIIPPNAVILRTIGIGAID